MAKLVYSAIASLDGYVADEDGNFDWAVPDEEVHAFINDLARPLQRFALLLARFPVAAYFLPRSTSARTQVCPLCCGSNVLQTAVGINLYGRRMYEVMVFWETAHSLPDQPPVMLDFAQIWPAADKIVYSKTLQAVSTAKTRIERDFDPEAVRQMKAQAGRDISVGGPELAAQAFKARLIDECYLFVAPMVVGGGKRSLPDNVRLKLELLDERRFDNGMVYLHYSTKT
jgi:dihydrofolate reductase